MRKNIYKCLLEGLRYTLILSAIAVLFGAVFGSLIAFGRLSNSRILRFICSAYTEVVRDTPLLVQIYLFVLIVPKAIGTIVSLSTFQAVAMAFAFNSAAYVVSIVRISPPSTPSSTIFDIRRG